MTIRVSAPLLCDFNLEKNASVSDENCMLDWVEDSKGRTLWNSFQRRLDMVTENLTKRLSSDSLFRTSDRILDGEPGQVSLFYSTGFFRMSSRIAMLLLYSLKMKINCNLIEYFQTQSMLESKCCY